LVEEGTKIFEHHWVLFLLQQLSRFIIFKLALSLGLKALGFEKSFGL
jgi:hypothetical protein